MNKLVVRAAVALSLIANGCATNPDKVQPIYVSAAQYRALSCPEIAREAIDVNNHVRSLTGQQKMDADKDATMMTVGLVLFWPALFFMSGGKNESELGNLKGQYDALKAAATEKDCKIGGLDVFASVPEPLKPTR